MVNVFVPSGDVVLENNESGSFKPAKKEITDLSNKTKRCQWVCL
jgi:hypothetical protein